MQIKTRRLQFLDLILWSETIAIASIINLFELEQLKTETKTKHVFECLASVKNRFAFSLWTLYFRKTLKSGEAMIAAGPIRYQNFPDSEEKQIRFEGLPVTLEI